MLRTWHGDGICFPDMETKNKNQRLPLDIDIRLFATSITVLNPAIPLAELRADCSIQYHENSDRAEEFVRTYNEMVSGGKHASAAALDGERTLSAYSLLRMKHCVGASPIPDYLAYRLPYRNGDKLRFITDPGHGWLECSLESARRSGAKISSFSYEDRNKGLAYLEEDCDAPSYLKIVGRYGEKMHEEHTDYDSFVRSLPHYGSTH